MSHSTGASAAYASPRSRLSRNARWLISWVDSEIVVYRWFQSTERPSVRNECSNAFSSSAVRMWHSSMKFRREIAFGGSNGSAGGWKSGS